MLPFLIGAEDDDRRSGLAAATERLCGATPVALRDLEALRADGRFQRERTALVLMPVQSAPGLDAAAAADFAAETAGKAFVVCVADAVSAEDYRRLVRSGAADWCTWDRCEDDLQDILKRWEGAAPTAEGAAKVVSFLPSKGGVGNTTLVIETAAFLAKRHGDGGYRIAVLDLGFQGGTAADALDVEARFDMGEIVHRPERLDEQLIDVFASPHASGFDLFAPPASRLAPDGVPPDTVFTLVDVIASRYDAVLFDLPGHWHAWTDGLLHGSDAILVSGGETVPAMKRLQATLGHVDAAGVPHDKVAAVVSAVDTDLLGRAARRGVIERALSGRRVFTVRRDHARLGEALDVGRPLLEVAPGTRVVRDFQKVAAWIETALAPRTGARTRRGATR